MQVLKSVVLALTLGAALAACGGSKAEGEPAKAGAENPCAAAPAENPCAATPANPCGGGGN